MSEAVSFAELGGQHVELLVARTVLSIFFCGGGKGGSASNGGSSESSILSGFLAMSGLSDVSTLVGDTASKV
jgi:hypothetical protein